MKHEEDGRLMAYVDGELVAEDARAVEIHVGDCPDCALATSRLRAEKARVRSTLSAVDVDVAAASRRVRERLRQRTRAAADESSRLRQSAASSHPRPATVSPAQPRAVPSARGRASGFPRRWILRTRTLQAALFVLFMAGGAAALVPGSPLRRWLQRDGSEAASTPARMQAPVEVAPLPQSSVSAVPAGGRLRIVLELPAGTELRVVPVNGERATVFADTETRFTSAEGVIEAAVTGGAVRVELPRGAGDASLEVNGQLYVRAQGGELRFTVPAADSSDAEVSFRIREP